MKWPSVYIIDRTKEYAVLKIKFIKNDNLLMAINFQPPVAILAKSSIEKGDQNIEEG